MTRCNSSKERAIDRSTKQAVGWGWLAVGAGASCFSLAIMSTVATWVGLAVRLSLRSRCCGVASPDGRCSGEDWLMRRLLYPLLCFTCCVARSLAPSFHSTMLLGAAACLLVAVHHCQRPIERPSSHSCASLLSRGAPSRSQATPLSVP